MNLDNSAPQPIIGGPLLDLLQHGGDWNSPRKSLEILARGYGKSPEHFYPLPLGAWNRALLRLRLAQSGPRLQLTDKCPACGEPVEFETDAGELLNELDGSPDKAERTVEQDRWKLRHRPLSGGDLVDATERNSGDPEEAGKALLRGTLLEVTRDGNPAGTTGMPQAVWEALASSISDSDPASEMVFDLKCPACDHRWESLFDPGDFLWKELAAASRRLLYQIHTIASAYGWTESTIVALGPERRRAYTAMIEESANGSYMDFGARHTQGGFNL